ncbi:hypothetical protein [Flavobacterium sp.]|uniref:hypothetical protein n=1 Tax=Flavobacterium sp. TaxID=239 RepID=UPI00286D3957|nr:hypothetical protein [Flavobacterium sp.]
MKKLVFTAIAVIAFSGAALASTVVEVNCEQVAIAALEVADADGHMTQQQSHDFYQGQLTACQKSVSDAIN